MCQNRTFVQHSLLKILTFNKYFNQSQHRLIQNSLMIKISIALSFQQPVVKKHNHAQVTTFCLEYQVRRYLLRYQNSNANLERLWSHCVLIYCVSLSSKPTKLAIFKWDGNLNLFLISANLLPEYCASTVKTVAQKPAFSARLTRLAVT